MFSVIGMCARTVATPVQIIPFCPSKILLMPFSGPTNTAIFCKKTTGIFINLVKPDYAFVLKVLGVKMNPISFYA